MEAAIDKKQTAFRFNANLVKRLKVEAKKENRSLNNYVEGLLMDMFYNTPNDATMDAIKEARSGKYAGTIDTSSMEAFIKSCEE